MKDSFVVITIGGRQHIVSEGEEITVNHVEGKVGDKMTIDPVLLLQDDSKTEIGKPDLNYAVTAEITKQFYGPKMHVRLRMAGVEKTLQFPVKDKAGLVDSIYQIGK